MITAWLTLQPADWGSDERVTAQLGGERQQGLHEVPVFGGSGAKAAEALTSKRMRLSCSVLLKDSIQAKSVGQTRPSHLLRESLAHRPACVTLGRAG
jgi:hypothetical protein